MSGKKLIGLLLILFGAGFFLQEADIIDFEQMAVQWWPVIIIIIGVIQLVYRTHSSVVSGLFFIVIGGLLLAGQWTDINIWAYVWPIIFICAGIAFLFSRNKHDKHTNKEEYIRVISVFSGSDIKSHAAVFKGGTIITVFGGAEIDLRNAELGEHAVIDITSLFGGVTLFVPDNTKLDISGLPIFGGWDDKTNNHSADHAEGRVLKLHCHTMFGGLEVRN